MNLVPTILLGLGGIGCEIVDRVYGLIPLGSRGHVVAHGFDTNVTDIQRRLDGHLKGHMTQTSRNQLVDHYLRGTDASVREWFPDHLRELRYKNLTDGAGQVRAVSRLAYRAAIQSGKLDDLHQQIRSLFGETGRELETGIRVMIVTTLAGGTGAGIFLQTALHLREYLQRLGYANVLVRGAFMLPDVLIHSGSLTPEEHENVRCNAYACLKELDAITRGDNRVTIELEFDPLFQKHPGLGERHRPFDFAFLFDDTNLRRNNLSALENYKRQMVMTTYTALFLPIADNLFSREDNHIIKLVEGRGVNRYGGAGIASVAYPYDDIVEYAALRWATTGLTEHWLHIDERYREEYRQWEQQLQAGQDLERPQLARRYVRLLDGLAEDDHRFFRLVHATAHTTDRRSRPDRPKSVLFLEALERETEARAAANPDVQELLAMAEIDPVRIANRDHARAHLRDVEDALDDLLRSVDDYVQEDRTYLSYEALEADNLDLNAVGRADHRLATWLVARDAPLHPVGARYLLYQVQLELERHLDGRDGRGQQNESLRQAIERYPSSYDDPDTEWLERAEDILDSVVGEGALSRFLSRRFTNFVEDWQERATRQRDRLRDYHRDRVKELVLRDTLKAVRELVSRHERYFDDLREVRNSLLTEVNRREREHEETGDTTRLFVLASAAAKQELWDEARLQVAAADVPPTGLPDDVARRMFLGHYRRWAAAKRDPRLVGDGDSTATESTFRKEILTWFRDQLRALAVLDKDVVQALRAEAIRHGHQPDDTEPFLTDIWGQLDRIATPWVPPIADPPADMAFWGIHPKPLEHLSVATQQDSFGDQLVVDQAFSRHEILRYRSVHLVRAEQLWKFAHDRGDGAEPGPYYRAYADRRERLTAAQGEPTVSPHLDKRWHVQAYLPDINERIRLMERDRVDRAFLDGLIHGQLRHVERDGRGQWVQYGVTPPRPILREGHAVTRGASALHGALFYNPGVVDVVLEQADRDRSREHAEYDGTPEHLKFVIGCRGVPGSPGEAGRNVIDVVLGMAAERRGSAEGEALWLGLLEAAIDHIHLVTAEAFGETRRNEGRLFADTLVRDLLDGSQTYQKAVSEDTTRGSRSEFVVAVDDLIKRRLTALRPIEH